MSWAASCSIASTRGLAAGHASDDAELLADLRRAGLGEDGADGRGDHLRRARGHLSENSRWPVRASGNDCTKASGERRVARTSALAALP